MHRKVKVHAWTVKINLENESGKKNIFARSQTLRKLDGRTANASMLAG